MKTFLYFVAGGVIASWIVAALLIASGDMFYNSGCLECSGLFNLSCRIEPPTLHCQFWGTLEDFSKSTQYLHSGDFEGLLIIGSIYGFLGGILGILTFLLKKGLVVLVHKVRNL